MTEAACAFNFSVPRPGYAAPLAQAEWSGPYLHDTSEALSSWEDLETGLLLLAAATLAHSVMTGRVGQFFGYFGYSLVMEIAAYCTNCLRHGLFQVMLTNFLPLKESMWYGLAFYPVGIAVERINPGLGWYGIAATAAAMHQLHNFAYDWQGEAPGITMFILNPEYEWADFSTDTTAWHKGICGIYFSHLGMGAAAAVATIYCRRERFSQLKTAGVIAASSIASQSVWGIYHGAKTAACLLVDTRELPSNMMERHIACIHSPFLKDQAIWLVSLAVVVATAAVAVNARGPGHDEEPTAMAAAPVCIVAAYHLMHGYVVGAYTPTAASSLAVMIPVSVTAVLLHSAALLCCRKSQKPRSSSVKRS
eukprot:TRINITY_DN7646_c0_g1_i1.p1 TRINITY_DN7646_c0_g1~~TRINITY_DN7646_c0_g1_i1.p1  ORF type:complete len:393 (+),score=113.96 TRINITY_DN7646_c0_g1_i1:88-1179(+)